MFDFLSQKFSGILRWVKGKGRLTEKNIADAIEQVREALLEADVPYDLVEEFLHQIREDIIGKKVQSSLNPGEQLIKVVYDTLLEFLGGKNALVLSTFQIPSIVMVMGLQGSGKTTTIAKLSHFILKNAKKKGKDRRILLGSVDFYRPAAVDQLEILAKQVSVDFYRAQNTDPVRAASEIYNYFKKNRYEVLFLDTAGRMHIDSAMMQELMNINSSLNPKYKILVLDAMTGQESLKVAQAFEQSVGFDSALLSKMDSDTRGGAAFAFRFALKKPISFVGSGEKIADLENFIPERMATRMLGMGDLQSLLEKADEAIGKKDQESMAKKFISGNFTLQDFANQLDMVGKMGSLQKVARFIPGMSGVSPEVMQQGQGQMKKFRAIISSMTKKERIIPQILDASRKQRIARGAGVNVQDINQLLQKFEQSRQFVKILKRKGSLGGFFK